MSSLDLIIINIRNFDYRQKLISQHIVYEVLEYYSHVYMFTILKCLSCENRIAIFEIRLSGAQHRSKI
jgi:hypothetical protein